LAYGQSADGLSLQSEIVCRINPGAGECMWAKLIADDADPEETNQLDTPGACTDDRIKLAERSATPSAEFVQQIIDQLPFLRRAVRRWHREAPDADDLVQDTLVQALANAHLWQAGSDLRAWLFTIMRNQFLAAVAKSNRAAALAKVCPPDGPVEDLGEARLVLRDVGAALRRLPTKQRAAIQLAGVEGKTYGEVAAVMGLSVGAVRSHLARARNRLKTAIGGSDFKSPCADRSARRPSPAATPPVFAHRSHVRVMAMAD
jgi:RNA polymerase sigma-70 factor, ECF subfamily